MFAGDEPLLIYENETIEIHFYPNTSSLANFFRDRYADSLINVDLSHFDSSLVTNMDRKFYKYSNFKSVDSLGANKDSGKINNSYQRKLEYSSYIKVKYDDYGAYYENGFNGLNSKYRKEISYIMYNNKQYTQNESLYISEYEEIEIHFSNPIKSLENFFNANEEGDNDESISSIDFSYFDSSSLENVKYLFYECKADEINLNNFNTSNVVSMEYMFYSCSYIMSIDLSSFTTSNVKNMSYMFFYSYSLTSLNLSNFNTSLVEDMSHMFHYCYCLKSIDLSNFNTKKTLNMEHIKLLYTKISLQIKN